MSTNLYMYIDSLYMYKGSMNPHDAYELGYCISLNRCQWKLLLAYLDDEFTDMKE